MRSAKEARETTAAAKLAKANEFWLKTISERIDGASAAGDTTAKVEFGGNQLDETTANEIAQSLIDLGYTVVYRHMARTQTYSFVISW